MTPDNLLTPEENTNAKDQLRIATKEAEIFSRLKIMGGEDSPITDLFVSSIRDFEERMAKADAAPRLTVGDHFLPHYTFQDVSNLTDNEVQGVINECLRAMERNGFGIDQPELVPVRQFYTWLATEFMKHEITMPIGGGWHMGFIYTELAPKSADAVNFWVKEFVEFLFEQPGGLSGATAHVDGRYGDKPGESYLPEPLARYVKAWRASWQALKDVEYIPRNYTPNSDCQGTFHFDLAYTVTRENGLTETLSGPGVAEVIFDGIFPQIVGMSFAGFALGRV